MNKFMNYIAGVNEWFRNAVKQNGKRDAISTFYGDFTIADKFGVNAIKSTYRDCFGGFKEDVTYMAELVVALNWKIWEHYDKGNQEFARVYDDLWRKADDYCCNHFKGEELREYYEFID